MNRRGRRQTVIGCKLVHTQKIVQKKLPKKYHKKWLATKM